MFDDKPANFNQPNNNAGSPPPPPPRRPAYNPPPPRPVSSAPAGFGGPAPEPPAPLREAQLSREVEDILGDIDTVQPQAKGPAVKPAFASQPVQTSAPVPKAEAKPPFFARFKKIIILAGILIVGGGAIAVGGWYAYRLIVSPPAVNAPANLNANAGIRINANANANQPVNQNEAAAPAPAEPVDTDRDGLTDEEEGLYGTDINQVDTDNDGLTDRDEAKVFKTDPNNPDTDGDSHLDGTEIRNGYDPKGPGKLLNIQ